MKAPVKAQMPPVMCTTPEPAKSTMPADPVVQDPAKQSHVSVAWLLLNPDPNPNPNPNP